MTSLSISALVQSATASAWFQRFISSADKLKLRASAWQSGSVARSELQIFSYAFAFADTIVSGLIQGGFLDFAASGTTTYVDETGFVSTSPVTPEGGPGALDVLTDGLYNAQRIQKTAAGGIQGFLNTSASTYGPVAAGTLHVSNPSTKIQYSSTAAITVPPSSAVGGGVATVQNYFGQVSVTTAAHHGLSTGQIVAIAGVLGIPQLAGTWFGRVTAIDVSTLALDGTSFSGTYTSGGTVYLATTGVVSADTEGSVSSSTGPDGVPAANTVTQLVSTMLGVTTGNVDVFFGSDQEKNAALAARARLALQSRTPNGPKGAYQYFVLSAAEWAAKLTPPLRLGATITREREFAFPADGTVYEFIANPTGAASAADAAVVNAVIQAFATPNAVTSLAVPATNKSVACSVTIWLPGAYANNAMRAQFQEAIQQYFIDLPIGGDTDPQGSYTNVVPLEGVAGACFAVSDAAKFKIQNVAVSLNNKALDLPLVVNLALLKAEVAVLLPAVPTVTLVAVAA